MFHVFQVPLDHLSSEQLDALLLGWMSGHEQKTVVTPNAEMILDARKDPEFLQLLRAADLALPDTVSLRFAVAAQGKRLRWRHAGSDTVVRFAELCAGSGQRLALFGASPGHAQKAAEALKNQFKDLDVVGIDPGLIERDKNGSLLDDQYVGMIDKHKPTVLAVALGAKKQEQFMKEYLEHLPSVRIAIGVGGTFEMLAGVLPRAPKWMRKLGFEWVWRLALEPKRYKRIYKAFVRFPVAVAYDTLKHGRFFFALRHVTPEVFRQLTGR